MSWLDDAGTSLKSWVSTDSWGAPPPPAATPDAGPPPDANPFGDWQPEPTTPADATAAFPQYAEDVGPPTGLLTDDEIDKINAAAQAAGSPEATSAALESLTAEERARIAELMECRSDAELPTGLLTPDEIEAMNDLAGGPEAELPMGLLTEEQIADLDRPYSQEPAEPELPMGLLTEEQIADLDRPYSQEPAEPELPMGLLTDEQIADLDRPYSQECTPTIEALTPEQRKRIAEQMQASSDDGSAPTAEPTKPMTPEESAAAARKAVDDSLAIMSDTLAQAKADEIAEIAMQEEDGFAAFGINDNKDKVAASLEGLPPEMRKKVLEKLGQREGDDALDAEQMETIEDAESSVTADEAHAKEKAKQVDAAVELAEKATKVDGNSSKLIEKSLDGLSEKRREEALEKMSPEARALAEDALEKRRKRLEKLADRLEAAQHGTGKTDCTDEAGIVAGLSGLTEAEADELQEIYGEKYKDGDDKPRSLKHDLKSEFGKDDKESTFISAVFDGDKEKADELSVDLTVEYLDDEAGAIFNTNEDVMNDLLRAHNHDKEAADKIKAAYKKRTGNDLEADCEDVMDEAEFKEAYANMEADQRTANVAVMEQGNKERGARVIEDVEDEPGGLEQLSSDIQDHTGKPATEVLKDAVPEEKFKEVETQVTAAQDAKKNARDKMLSDAVAALKPEELEKANAKAEEIAGKLDTALSQMHVVGNNTDVTQHLRGLKPEELKLVMDHYAKKTASLSEDGEGKNLEEELQKKLTGKDLKVATAVMSGDKVLAAVAFVQQAADNAGTDVDGWSKAMETLETPAERKRFEKMMSQHEGGTDAYGKLVRSETSSFERDSLLALAIEDEDERAGALAVVNFTKNAYGGKLAGWNEGLGDTIGELTGETEAHRTQRRQMDRKYGLGTRFSNLGGSEDAQLDAMSGLKNEKQQRIFNDGVKEQTGKTTEEIVEEEMSGHHAETGKKFAGYEYEAAQAERMVAELDCIVDNREDAASKPFEEVRLTQDQLDRIGKVPEGAERDQALKDEKAKARASLLEKADEAAVNAGYDSYLGMLEAKGLTKAELDMAKERIADGQVSEVTQLFKAGDTAVGNLGKDSTKFYEVMQGKSPEQMDELRTKWKEKHPDIDFDDWVRSKATSAGQKRDFEIMLEGNYARMPADKLAEKAADPEGQRALIKRVKDLEAAARGGADDNKYDLIGTAKRKVGNAAGNLLADSIGNAGDRLDGRMEKVTKLEDKLDRGEELTTDEQAELVTHMRYMAGDQKAYTDTKTSAVNAGAEVVGTIAEAGTIALTGNQTLGTAANGVAKMEVKGTFDPGRYGADEMVADGIQLLADTAGSALGGKTKVPGLDSVVEGAAGGLGQGLGDTKNWNDAGKLVDSTGRSVATSTATAVASAGVEGIGGDGLATKFASATVEELVSGDEGATLKERVKNVGKSVVQESATDAGKNHHKKHNPSPSNASPTPDAPSTPTVDAPTVDTPTVDTSGPDAPTLDTDGPIIVPPSVPPPSHDDPPPSSEQENGVSVHPIINVGPAPSAFGDEKRSQRRSLEADTKHGKVKATVSQGMLSMKYPAGISDAEKRALTRDALARFGLDASDSDIDAQAANADGITFIPQRLHVRDGAAVQDAARAVFMTPEMIASRAGDTPKSLEGECENESTRWQGRLAEQGIFVPIVNAESNPAAGRYGHKFIVVGDTIIDPTIAQFFGDSDEEGANEPFVGTYPELRERVQRAIDEGRMPDYANADDALAKQWGIKPDADGKLGFDEGVKPLTTKGIVPKDDAEVRRLMDEQKAAGIPPGQGLEALVDAVDEVQTNPRPPKTHGGASSAPEIEVHDWDPGIGSQGTPMDPNYVPGPGEPVNWGANNGGIGPAVPERLAPGTMLHRTGSPKGSYFAPDGTPIPERSLPPTYGPDGVPLDYTPEEYFYEVGPGGMPVEMNVIAPGFAQPGGGVQYQAPKGAPTDKWNPNAESLVKRGELIEVQQNIVKELSPEEREEVLRIVREAEADDSPESERAPERAPERASIDMTPDPRFALPPIDLAAVAKQDQKQARPWIEKAIDFISKPFVVADDEIDPSLAVHDAAALHGNNQGAPNTDASKQIKPFADAYSVVRAAVQFLRTPRDQNPEALGDGVLTVFGKGAEALAEMAFPGSNDVIGQVVDNFKAAFNNQPGGKLMLGKIIQELDQLEGSVALDRARELINAIFHTDLEHKTDGERERGKSIAWEKKKLMKEGLPSWEAEVRAEEIVDERANAPKLDLSGPELDGIVDMATPEQAKHREERARVGRELEAARTQLRVAPTEAELAEQAAIDAEDEELRAQRRERRE